MPKRAYEDRKQSVIKGKERNVTTHTAQHVLEVGYPDIDVQLLWMKCRSAYEFLSPRIFSVALVSSIANGGTAGSLPVITGSLPSSSGLA